MLRIAICDDDASQIEETRQAVAAALGKSAPELELFSTSAELLRALEQGGYRPDIAILDIQMPGDSGIAVGQRLNQVAPLCRIIFLTSYIGYATDVYDTKHSYFALKSELARRIGPALHQALADIERTPRLVFRADGEMWTVGAEEVLYLERNLRKTRIVCLEREYETSGKAEELLAGAAGSLFIRCHQSFWVNLRHVKAMGPEHFTFANGETVPISRGFRSKARTAFFESLGR